jgi:hypothetical protein
VNTLERMQLELAEMQAGSRSEWSARLVWQAARGGWPRIVREFEDAILGLPGVDDPAWDPIDPSDEAHTRLERLISRARTLEIMVDEIEQQRDVLADRAHHSWCIAVPRGTAMSDGEAPTVLEFRGLIDRGLIAGVDASVGEDRTIFITVKLAGKVEVVDMRVLPVMALGPCTRCNTGMRIGDGRCSWCGE